MVAPRGDDEARRLSAVEKQIPVMIRNKKIGHVTVTDQGTLELVIPDSLERDIIRRSRSNELYFELIPIPANPKSFF